ncbi:hypothetical protein J5N97_000154 [Dioscorea zingiberensis]|uniref:NB-ARC domain-containing protein n=1 Tax=Dioscorea zingiberensis TaxID=325984 RepID=A0A9D5BSN9_9LILI|nr:hypothetical protein J5N97_000154 [Dioscorea zingiberensis]
MAPLVPMRSDQPTNYDNLESRDERVTTSTTSQKKIHGRDSERKQLIEMLKMSRAEGNVCVLPILGMGGIGKTALAQSVFNDKEIENHFHYRTWIHISDNFNRPRITREILESLKDHQFPRSTNLDNMERKIQQTLKGKRFLLVLDDVWSHGWMVLLNHLESADVECVKIVVTARDSKVLGRQGNLNGLTLQGLKDDEYWSFFVKCVFGQDRDLDHAICPPMLESIGKQITKKLKGSPLAAKTVGRLLWNDKREEQWAYVLNNHLWELGTEEDDIMPALALSYNHLSEDLQRCFAFCSLFPTDHKFTVQDVVYMWIAHGYIPQVQGSSKTAEDIGREYFDELLSIYFFQPCQDSPCFKFHSLAHDLARSVSKDENFTYDADADADPKPVEVEVIKRVRHLWARGDPFLSIEGKTTSLRTHVAHGTEAELHIWKRRELQLLKNYCSAGSGWIWELEIFRRIRVLVLYNYAVEEFPDLLDNFKHLRYLDLCRTSIKSAPESLCVLYHLNMLRLPDMYVLPDLFHRLVNLRFFRVNTESTDAASAYEIEFPVKRDNGYKIAQLRNMNELRGTLVIRTLENIDNREDARNANLHHKRHIECLHLVWSNAGEDCEPNVAEEVLEGLRPHSQLKKLHINGYIGVTSPSWLLALELKNLREIELHGCKNWATLPPFGKLPYLNILSLHDMKDVTIEGDHEAVTEFPFLEKLELEGVSVTFNGMQTGSCIFFPCLIHLRIVSCDRVRGLPWPMLSKLQKLQIQDSMGLGDQFPGCLIHLTSLVSLNIVGQTCNVPPP